MISLKYRDNPIKEIKEKLNNTNINPVVLDCLIRRGINNPEIALLNQKLISYKNMKGIRDIAIKLAQAILNKEKIIVVADYDCDGATACTIAVSGLGYLGANIDFVVPNRLKHGYGLTPSVVDIVATKKPQWIITVDNGIASNDGVDRANELGIKVLVTDHHLPGEKLPKAEVLVDPNQKGCEFESKNLAGCGVMFYVLAATRDALRSMGSEVAKTMDVSEWLDIVALGTIADVVKLDDNNRWLVNQGLKRIRNGQMRPGIKALFKVSKKNPYIATSQDFGFSLGPRLNAAGRIKDMSIGIKCLLSDNYDEAYELATILDGLNEKRKDIEKGMKETAQAEIEAEKQKNKFTKVIFDESFHEGVIGIVAGRIKEQFYTPTIVFAQAKDGQNWKGSARSIPGCHLRDVIDNIYKKHPKWFLTFGGHSMAAGLTITQEGKKYFPKAFEEEVERWFDYVKPKQYLLVDDELNEKDINIYTTIALSQNVWGQGFEEPSWYGKFIVNKSEMIGKDLNHLKLNLSPMGSYKQVTALHFFQTEENQPKEGDILEMVYKLQYSEFKNEGQMSLIIVDR